MSRRPDRLVTAVAGILLSFAARSSTCATTQDSANPTASRYTVVQGDVDPELVSLVAARSETFVDQLCEALSLVRPTATATVRLFPSGRELNRFLDATCPRQRGHDAAACETADGFVIAIAKRRKDAATLRLLRHELVHFVLWSSFTSLPRWIDEGVALYAEPDEGIGAPNRAQLAHLVGSDRGRDDELDELVTRPLDAKFGKREYARSWGLTHYLLSRPGGRDAVLCYLRGVEVGPAAVATFEECFGHRPADLQDAAREHRSAVRARKRR